MSDYIKYNKHKRFLKQLIVYAIFVVTFLSVSISCKSKIGDCFNASDEIDSVTYDFSNYTTIDVYDIFEVYIKQDSFYRLKVVCNSDLLDDILIEQKDSVIEISDHNTCYFTKLADSSIKVYITAPNLKNVNFYCASSLYSIDTLEYERFLFRAYGKLAFADLTINCSDHFFLSLWDVSGDFKIRGYAKYFESLFHGNAYADAFDLKTEVTKVDHRSTGDIKVSATNKIKVQILDIGNIYYKGNPEIEATITGTGKIIKVD